MTTMTEITARETDLIRRIADRAVELYRVYSTEGPHKKSEFILELMIAKAANKMDLEALLESDDVSFAHDIGGINLNMDRETGKFLNFFKPFCARAGREV